MDRNTRRNLILSAFIPSICCNIGAANQVSKKQNKPRKLPNLSIPSKTEASFFELLT